MLTRRSLFRHAAVAVIAVPMVAMEDEIDLDLSDLDPSSPLSCTGNAGDVAITAGVGSPSLQEALDRQEVEWEVFCDEQERITIQGWNAFAEGMRLKAKALETLR